MLFTNITYICNYRLKILEQLQNSKVKKKNEYNKVNVDFWIKIYFW